eukprot:CAMPEP_0172452940 /NCGR_PEP_ID=MMETSP1065-20121228/10456_1 /TAXON_ID=265537 /ORGANISM="Amphiprora paludosa, Strain CCMP125" /LENGTH=776 /DNA_ID=CAMNT_0013205085 /DNA_START=103 /DNA_END=2433 /DNA_ORIENTATION=-
MMIRPFVKKLATQVSSSSSSTSLLRRSFSGAIASQQSHLFSAPSTKRQQGVVPCLHQPPLFSFHHNTTSLEYTGRGFSSTSVVEENTEGEADYQVFRRKGLRNVAIIAHVDHGKTTLVDELLMAAQKSHANHNPEAESLDRLMDSGDLEKERGITITSKVTRVNYQQAGSGDPYVLNIVDTPGHADFSGEVDRILSMVDGVCLVVDAVEGPMTQTKYVLSRALSAGLKPIVVLNKCDRPEAVSPLDSGETETKLMNLFEALGADEDQIDFITMYASAREGWVVLEDPFVALELAADGYKGEEEHSMKHLLEAIIDNIPEPSARLYEPEAAGITAGDDSKSLEGTDFEKDPFSLAIVSVGRDSYLGRTCTGRIVSGSVALGDEVTLLARGATDSATAPSSLVSGLFCYEGVSRIPMEGRAFAGDCVTVAGVPDDVAVGDTITSKANPVKQAIDTPPLAPPTLSMDFGSNNGPLAGKEPNTIVASSKIRDRLVAETDNNVTLKIEKSEADSEKTTVYARGELQLGILVEQMRREGFEMMLSPPRVLTTIDPDSGEEMEPFEEVIIDVDAEYSGTVVSSLTNTRKGQLVEMNDSADGKTRLLFQVPSRGLLGFSSEIASATRGSAVVNHVFLENRPHLGLLESSFGKPKLVCNTSGKATSYALQSLSARGTLFVEPGDELYSGMVVGENSKSGPDVEVNAVRAKEVTNMRAAAKDDTVRLAPPMKLSLEQMIGYMAQDEVIEVTPSSIRLRKAILDSAERDRAARLRAKQIRAMKGGNK